VDIQLSPAGNLQLELAWIFCRFRLKGRALLGATLMWTMFCCLHARAEAPALAPAVAQVSCEISTMGKSYWVSPTPTSGRYQVAATPVSKRFRFRLLVSGLESQIDSIQIDVQATTERQPVLVHQAILTPPFATNPALLNGENRVYSPAHERELWYRCRLKPTSIEESSSSPRSSKGTRDIPSTGESQHVVDRAPDTSVSIVLAGDIMLDEIPGRFIRNGRDPLRAVAKQLASADILIGNLESVV
jgi:hypothetical protein